MRLSTIPVVKLKRKEEPKFLEAVCVGCKRAINPTFCRTGSIISGMGFATKKGIETTPVIATIETPFKSYIIGGDTIETVKNVAFYKRDKGYLCTECSSIYRTLKIPQKNGEVRIEPVVKLDPLPGTINTTKRGSYLPVESGNVSRGRKSEIPSVKLR